jgi:Ca2+-binding EF-hand superfamily protein
MKPKDPKDEPTPEEKKKEPFRLIDSERQGAIEFLRQMRALVELDDPAIFEEAVLYIPNADRDSGAVLYACMSVLEVIAALEMLKSRIILDLMS